MKIKVLLVSALITLLMSSALAMEHTHGSSDKKTDCNISAGPCLKIMEEENIRVLFHIDPVPVKSMEELLFSVTLEKNGRPLTDAKVAIDLTMPGMFMGVNRPVLTHQGKGRYEGKGVLPLCPHGGKVWRAEAGIEINGKRASVSYVFEVE